MCKLTYFRVEKMQSQKVIKNAEVNNPFTVNMSNYTSAAKTEKSQILLKLQKELRDIKCRSLKFICNKGLETIEKCSAAEPFFDSKDCCVLISHLCRQILSDCGDYKNIIKLMTYDIQYRNTQPYPLSHILISWVQRDDKPPE